MAVHPLRPATDRRLGGPLPHQLANQTRVHLTPINLFRLDHAILSGYAVLAVISNCYPPVWGRLPTRYSPVRHSVTFKSTRRSQQKCFVRLACVKHAASVHPEPGSNSHVKILCQKKLTSFSLLTVFKVALESKFYAVLKSLKEIFRVVSLFDYQGSSLSAVIAATFIEYHVFNLLSTLFSIFLWFIFFWTSAVFTAQKVYYHSATPVSTKTFQNFQIIF